MQIGEGHVGAKIQPGQVGALQRRQLQLGELGQQGVVQIVEVALDLLQHGLQPFLAAAESGLRGHVAKAVAAEHPQVFHVVVVLAAQAGIGDDDVGVLGAGQVECLGGGAEGDQVVVIVAHRGGGDMLGPVEQDILMDLVGEDEDLMLAADLQHLLELVFGPDPAHRIVGGGHDEQPHIVLHHLAFKVGEVDAVAAVVVDERAFDEAAFGVGHRVMEGVVDRGLQQHRVAGLGEDGDQPVQAADDAGAEADPFPLDLVAVVALLPADEVVEVGVRGAIIAERARIHVIVQGFTHAFRRFEIHVRDPHGQQVGAFEMLAEVVPFSAVGMEAVRQ